MQAYGSVSVTEICQVLGCGARPREEERDNREMAELSGKWRHRAMKTSCTNLEQQLPEPVLV